MCSRHFSARLFRDQHGASLSAARRRAMTAIEKCRTAALSGHVDRCDECGHQRVSHDSCRNRNCPKRQGLARAQWLEDRRGGTARRALLPRGVHRAGPDRQHRVPEPDRGLRYPVPGGVRDVARTIAADPEHLGAEIGFLGVLHTWGQNFVAEPSLMIPGIINSCIFSEHGQTGLSSVQSPCKVSLPGMWWRRSMHRANGCGLQITAENSPSGARRVHLFALQQTCLHQPFDRAMTDTAYSSSLAQTNSLQIR